MKKIVSTTITILSVAFILWAALSWGEVVLKNKQESPTYSQANLFVILTDAVK